MFINGDLVYVSQYTITLPTGFPAVHQLKYKTIGIIIYLYGQDYDWDSCADVYVNGRVNALFYTEIEKIV